MFPYWTDATTLFLQLSSVLRMVRYFTHMTEWKRLGLMKEWSVSLRNSSKQGRDGEYL